MLKSHQEMYFFELALCEGKNNSKGLNDGGRLCVDVFLGWDSDEG